MNRVSKIICVAIISFANEAICTMPVVDYSVIVKMIQEYQLLESQLKYITDQYDLMDSQSKMMAKRYGYGDDWRGEDELWMPENVGDFQDWVRSSDEYKYYDKLFPNDPSIIDPHNESSQEREQYEYSANWNNYSRVAFKRRFDEAQSVIKRINEMIKEIDKLESPKQSADFQIRMMGELAKLSQQQTELQGLQLHLMTIQLEDVKLAKEHNADFWKYKYGQ